MRGEILEIKGDTKHQTLNTKQFTNLQNELSELASDSNDKVSTKGDIDGFKKELTRSIRMRLISEVSVGSCLSGGLDSSTVVATVNKLLYSHVEEASSVGKIQNTFSAVFPGSSNDEERYINKLKSQISNFKSHKVYPKPEEFFREIEDFVRIQEEPTISTGPYAQYKVMEEAHKNVTVVLDGQGADEMMAGYLPYYLVYFRQLWKEKKYLLLIQEVFTSSDVITAALINHLIKAIQMKKDVDVATLLQKSFCEKFKDEHFNVTNDRLKKRLLEDIFSNSLPSLLRYEDKNAMRFSIEGRVPFLDFDLLKYLFKLPDDMIIKNGWNKNILREAVSDLLPPSIVKRRNKIGFTTPEYEWFMQTKNKINKIFMSESFGKRPYFNQKEVIGRFQNFIEGKNTDTMVFWRLLNLELWLRVFFDSPSYKTSERQAEIKSDLSPNEGKKIEIMVEGRKYQRYPIYTALVKKGDDVEKIISDEAVQAIGQLNKGKKFFVGVSEKIIAISQGRSYFIWDIKPGFLARLLSRYVTRTPSGIGLGSPWTMELAISEIGLPKIILAAIGSVLTKPFGVKGIFYKIAGQEAASIDGPTEYSVYPSNVSAKLGPKEPHKVAEQIHKKITQHLTPHIKQKFIGVVIIDANDIGQNVLGNSTRIDNKLIERIFSDNPMGQTDEQTPLVICVTSE